MDSKFIKIIGVGATVIGAAASVIGSLATKKETDNKIAEECAKAVAEALGNKES